jgi:hypothetical protein
MNLQPDETEITGAWIREGSNVRGDAACERIEHLLREILQKLGGSKAAGDWEMLYRDPADGRFWERTYPQSHMHGGGPPKLVAVSREDALLRYGAEVVDQPLP